MVRDLILVSCLILCLGVTLRYAFAGVLTWAWVALMQPYTEVYGPVSSSARINLLVAVVAIIAWLSHDKRLHRPEPIITVTGLFLAWMTFNEFFAFNPDASWNQWNRDWRIIVFGLLVWATANTKVRIHALIWVITASLLYYGVKSGILTITAGGAKKLMGPAGGMYGDNNQFAVALLIILPLIIYLRGQSANRYLRIGLLAGFVLTLLAILGSYSRGAFVALAVLALAWWLRSRNKIQYILFAVSVAIPLFYFMPDSYLQRIQTIDIADQDGSFQGRVNAWKVAFYYARDHFPIGAGLDGPQQPAVFNHYLPGEVFRASHSIYFQVLGDLGFAGLALYLVILALIFRYCSSIRKATRGVEELTWAYELATSIQLSMVAFCVGGAALSLAYSDFLFIWIGLLPQLWLLARRVQPEQLRRPMPAWARTHGAPAHATFSTQDARRKA